MDEELNRNSIDVACVFEFSLEFMEYDFWNISAELTNVHKVKL